MEANVIISINLKNNKRYGPTTYDAFKYDYSSQKCVFEEMFNLFHTLAIVIHITYIIIFFKLNFQLNS